MHSGAASFPPEILSWHGKLAVEFARGGEPKADEKLASSQAPLKPKCA